jgi:hypothetical protein
MITGLNYSLFPSNEFFTFSKNAVTVVDSKKAAIPAVIPFLSVSQVHLANFADALERESKNPLVQIRSKMHGYRIDAFLAFRNLSESASSRRKAGVSEAAQVIINLIRKYGWTVQMFGQKAASGVFNGFISELKEKYTAEVALIGGTELLEELEQAQADYEVADNNVLQSESANTELTVAETRPLLTEALRQMFQIVSLQETAAPSADVTALIALLNELITSSLSTVKASDTRAKNAKKKEEEAKKTE